jgi:hypothetical protein
MLTRVQQNTYNRHGMSWNVREACNKERLIVFMHSRHSYSEIWLINVTTSAYCHMSPKAISSFASKICLRSCGPLKVTVAVNHTYEQYRLPGSTKALLQGSVTFNDDIAMIESVLNTGTYVEMCWAYAQLTGPAYMYTYRHFF